MQTLLIASQSAAMRAGIRALLSADPEFRFLEDRMGALPEFSQEERKAVLIFHEEDWDWVESILLEPQDLLMIGDQYRSLQMLLRAQGHVWGMISVRAAAEALRAALLAISQGLIVFPGKFGSDLSTRNNETGPNLRNYEDLADPLTEREIEVLGLLTQGLQNKQIALRLNISENTIKFHVSSIYSKLGVSNRTEAVRRGTQLGLVAL
jgi:DNA-binding CsgD family transcriptional regulator